MADAWHPVRGPDRVTIGRWREDPEGIRVKDDRWGIESVHARFDIAERHCIIRAAQSNRLVAEVAGEVVDNAIESERLHVELERFGRMPTIGEPEKAAIVRIIERGREITARTAELQARLRGEAAAR